MKVVLELGQMDVWSILPVPAIVFDPAQKELEVGIYFLKYCVTLNIEK